MASDLLRLTAWADAHGLQLNPAKSSLLVVGSPALRQQLSSFVISWGSTSLPMQHTVKILGVTFDPSWCFDQHVAVFVSLCFRSSTVPVSFSSYFVHPRQALVMSVTCYFPL